MSRALQIASMPLLGCPKDSSRSKPPHNFCLWHKADLAGLLSQLERVPVCIGCLEFFTIVLAQQFLDFDLALAYR